MCRVARESQPKDLSNAEPFFRGSEANHDEIYIWDLAPPEGVESGPRGGCGRLLLHGCGWKEVSGFFGAADVCDAGAQEQGGDSVDSGSGSGFGVRRAGMGDDDSRGVGEAAGRRGSRG